MGTELFTKYNATNVALNLPKAAGKSIALYKKPFHWLIVLRHLARSLNVIERQMRRYVNKLKEPLEGSIIIKFQRVSNIMYFLPQP